MVRTEVPRRLSRKQRLVGERGSSTEATIRWAAVSRPGLTQMLRLQYLSIGAQGGRRPQAEVARKQCQCPRFPPLQLQAGDSRRTPEPDALHAAHDAVCRAA